MGKSDVTFCQKTLQPELLGTSDNGSPFAHAKSLFGVAQLSCRVCPSLWRPCRGSALVAFEHQAVFIVGS